MSLNGFAQQEPQYTQNQFNTMLMINPAYAGANDYPSLGLRYRNQWLNLDGAPSTLNLNGETGIFSDKLGLGLAINHDKIGILRNTSADLNIASHIQLNEKIKVGAGIKLGVDFLKSDFSLLTNVSASDPLYSDDKAAIPYIGIGGLLYSELFYIGISSPRIASFENNSPQTDISEPHFYLNGGYRFICKNGLEFRPAILGKYQNKAPFEMDFSLHVWYKEMVGFGAAYRTNDAVNFMVNTKLNRIILAYSYDMTVSGLRNYNTGSHEIHLGFEFGSKTPDRNENNRYF
mgnify:CR=1 FL=1